MMTPELGLLGLWRFTMVSNTTLGRQYEDKLV